MTQPEISIQVNLLGRRSASPAVNNMRAALALLGYLHWTRHEGLILPKPISLELVVYADAPYGGEQGKSQTGVLITLGNNLVGWYSRRQDIVPLSITGGEYIANCEGAKDAAWAEQLLNELRISITLSLRRFMEGAYNLSNTPGGSTVHQLGDISQRSKTPRFRIYQVAS
jgi:hypothetical protein